MNKEILNKAIELGLEFGENWLMPVDDRIKAVYPALTGDQLVYLNNHVKELLMRNKVAEHLNSSRLERHRNKKFCNNNDLLFA